MSGRRQAALCGLVVLALGCRGPAPEAGPGAPVILISIDTLRSDRLPAYGYTQVDTPAIDALRRDAILFERAFSPYPLTLPAHATLLSGLLPGDHGVRDNMGYTLNTNDIPYLPRALRDLGYATGAAVSSYVLRGASGLAEGFELYDDGIESGAATALGGVQRRGDETLTIALDWLDGVQGRPPFLFFHIYEPHSPWEPPEPFRSRYRDPYDGEVAAADAIVGQLIEALKARGLYDPAILILTSDHGEGLGDHGELEHGILLYREALQVPLFVKLPGQLQAGRSVPVGAQLADVVPTVLALLGQELPAELAGTSLLEIADTGDQRPLYAETYYPRLHMGWSELHSLIQGDHHLIDGPDPELYDIGRDPEEKRNLAREARREFVAMRGELRSLLRPLEPPGQVDSDTAARLAALGYLAGPRTDVSGPLPDPKSKIHLFEDLGGAHLAIQRGHPELAIPRLERLLAENPEMHDAWVTLGHALQIVGRNEAAVEANRRAIELSGPVPHLLVTLASLYLELGRTEQAEDHARMAAELNPAWGHQKLAEIALVRGDIEAAEHEAGLAVAARGSQIGPLIAEASILLRRGKLDEAAEIVRLAGVEMERRTTQQPPAGFHFIRGDLLARRGDLEAAGEQFRRELELHPDHLDSSARLAFVYTATGKPQRAVAILREMVEERPTPAAYATAVETLRLLDDPASADALLEHALGLFPEAERLHALHG